MKANRTTRSTSVQRVTARSTGLVPAALVASARAHVAAAKSEATRRAYRSDSGRLRGLVPVAGPLVPAREP
jgi:hypothetical protein